jgi:hypothetical protein
MLVMLYQGVCQPPAHEALHAPGTQVADALTSSEAEQMTSRSVLLRPKQASLELANGTNLANMVLVLQLQVVGSCQPPSHGGSTHVVSFHAAQAWVRVAPLAATHGAPPPELGVVTVKMLTCSPSPQVLLQTDQPSQLPTQSTGGTGQGALSYSVQRMELPVGPSAWGQAVPPLPAGRVTWNTSSW